MMTTQEQLEKALTLTIGMQRQALSDNWAAFEQLFNRRTAILNSMSATAAQLPEACQADEQLITSLIKRIQMMDHQIHQLAEGKQRDANKNLKTMNRGNQAIAAYKQI